MIIMERRNLIHILLFMALLSVSCSRDVKPEGPAPEKGSFILSSPQAFRIDMTKSSVAVHSAKSGDMEAQWSEGVWDSSFGDMTRSNVTGDEYSWEDSTTVSIYITDTDGVLLTQSGKADGLGDIPLNPVTYKSYTTYRPYMSNETSKAEITDEQHVSNAAFFWNEKKTGRPQTMPEHVNFYGYYPRPFDGDANSLYYVKTSIIEKESAHSPFGRDDWYLLPYSFFDIQTDENLSYHDVMCSIPENGGPECNSRYGNQSKSSDSNVQMHFRHVFSLLRIKIDKGEVYDKDGHKDCIISDLTLSGSEIYTQGKLNILTGETFPALSGNIIRDIPAGTSIKDSPLSTTMIVQPIAKMSGNAGDGVNAGRFNISCKVDGIPFSCSIPDISLEPGKKYDINLSLKPSGGFVFRVWNGAEVSFGGGEKRYSDAGEYNEVRLDYDSFSVSPDAESKIVRVICNGKEVAPDALGNFALIKGSDTPIYYDVVASPSDWYVTDAMRIHFDALWNNKYKGNNGQDTEWAANTIWSDLSGHENDGSLKSFNSTEESGWYGKGLNFDGNDDIVTYPGNVNATEYTLEFYLYVPAGYRQKSFSRLTAEGGRPNGYPCVYFSGGFNRDIELYAHGCQGGIWGGSSNYFNGTLDPNVNLVQLDCVFSYADKTFTVYCNGDLGKTYGLFNCTEALSVPIASLGNRIQDNTRAIKATFYSFVLYDRGLSQDEIRKNYEVNKARYGTLHQ